MPLGFWFLFGVRMYPTHTRVHVWLRWGMRTFANCAYMGFSVRLFDPSCVVSSCVKMTGAMITFGWTCRIIPFHLVSRETISISRETKYGWPHKFISRETELTSCE